MDSNEKICLFCLALPPKISLFHQAGTVQPEISRTNYKLIFSGRKAVSRFDLTIHIILAIFPFLLPVQHLGSIRYLQHETAVKQWAILIIQNAF